MKYLEENNDINDNILAYGWVVTDTLTGNVVYSCASENCNPELPAAP